MGLPALLLPLAGKAALGTGITTGLTAAGLKLGSMIPGIGLDKEGMAKGESVNLLRPDTLDDYSIIDRFKFGVLGLSEKDVAQQAAINQRQAIQDELAGITSGIQSYRTEYGMGDGFDLSMQTGENRSQYNQRLKKELQRLEAYDEAIINKVPQALLQGKTSAQIKGIQNEFLENKQEELRKERLQEAETQRLKIRQENLADIREKQRIDAGIRRDDLNIRLAQLQAQQQQAAAQNNLQLQQMINQNNRLDRQDARNARKDQQALIMMLVQGLGNGLGNLSF